MNLFFGRSDAARSRLRSSLAVMEREVHHQPVGPLLRAFNALVAELELGPEPKLRRCPLCGTTCFSKATRCGGCWQKLAPE